MKKNVIERLLVACILTISLGSTTRVGDTEAQQSERTGKRSTKTAGLSLDIIVGGPFAFVETTKCSSALPSCLIVAAPDVASHSGMIGVAGGAEIKQFVSNAAYDFTIGLRPAGSTTVDAPVLGATILNVSKSNGHLPQGLISPFATIELPMPREIVPWNSDPMQISSTMPIPPATAQQALATLTILRYDFQDSDNLQMNDASGPFWKPLPLTSGNERIVLIGIIPQDPTASEDEHVHATEAFSAMVKMVGLTWFVNFVDPPPPGFQRNRPPNPASPLPPDLQNIVDPLATPAKTDAAFISGPQVTILGRINDCKAPALLITP